MIKSLSVLTNNIQEPEQMGKKMLMKNVKSSFKKNSPSYKTKWDRRGRDRMVVGFIAVHVISAYQR